MLCPEVALFDEHQSGRSEFNITRPLLVVACGAGGLLLSAGSVAKTTDDVTLHKTVLICSSLPVRNVILNLSYPAANR